jgi:hypothetical protein
VPVQMPQPFGHVLQIPIKSLARIHRSSREE